MRPLDLVRDSSRTMLVLEDGSVSWSTGSSGVTQGGLPASPHQIEVLAARKRILGSKPQKPTTEGRGDALEPTGSAGQPVRGCG